MVSGRHLAGGSQGIAFVTPQERRPLPGESVSRCGRLTDPFSLLVRAEGFKIESNGLGGLPGSAIQIQVDGGLPIVSRIVEGTLPDPRNEFA